MIDFLYRLLLGWVEVTISGRHPEEIISQLALSGQRLWAVRKTAAGYRFVALLKGVASLSHLEIKPFRPTKTPLAILERPHILELLAVIQLIHRELPNVIIEIHVDHLSQDTQDLLVMHGVSRLLITREELEG